MGLCVGLCLPGAGAQLLPVQEGEGGVPGVVSSLSRVCVLPLGPPAQCHPLFSAHRAPEPAVAAAPPCDLRPGQESPLHPYADFGRVVCPPPAQLSFHPSPSVSSVPNKASQLDPVPFTGGRDWCAQKCVPRWVRDLRGAPGLARCQAPTKATLTLPRQPHRAQKMEPRVPGWG